MSTKMTSQQANDTTRQRRPIVTNNPLFPFRRVIQKANRSCVGPRLTASGADPSLRVRLMGRRRPSPEEEANSRGLKPASEDPDPEDQSRRRERPSARRHHRPTSVGERLRSRRRSAPRQSQRVIPEREEQIAPGERDHAPGQATTRARNPHRQTNQAGHGSQHERRKPSASGPAAASDTPPP